MYITEATTKEHLEKEINYGDYLTKVEKKLKDMCPTCKAIMDRIFELRKDKILQLVAEINHMYDIEETQISTRRRKEKGGNQHGR